MPVCELQELMYIVCPAHCLTPSRCSKKWYVHFSSTICTLIELRVSSSSGKYSKDLLCLPCWSTPARGDTVFSVYFLQFSQANICASAPCVHSPLQVRPFQSPSCLAFSSPPKFPPTTFSPGRLCGPKHTVDLNMVEPHDVLCWSCCGFS